MTDAKVALVAGAAGGVGRALLTALIDDGYNVVAEDISPAVESLASDQVAVVRGDSADAATADQAVQLAIETFGGLDLLVNNAALPAKAHRAHDRRRVGPCHYK